LFEPFKSLSVSIFGGAFLPNVFGNEINFRLENEGKVSDFLPFRPTRLTLNVFSSLNKENLEEGPNRGGQDGPN
jgi:hypothetical protein